MATSGVKGLPTPDDGDSLIRRVEALERALPQGLASVAQSFAGTVQTLQDAIDEINEIIGEQVAFITDEVGLAGFAMPAGSTASVVASNVVVPDGYTQMSIMAVGTVHGNNNSGADGYLYSRVQVEGLNVSELIASPLTTAGLYGVCYINAAHSETVTPGETITVDLLAKGDFAAWGTSLTGANLSVIYLFSR